MTTLKDAIDRNRARQAELSEEYDNALRFVREEHEAGSGSHVFLTKADLLAYYRSRRVVK